jgi:hypothetical protein
MLFSSGGLIISFLKICATMRFYLNGHYLYIYTKTKINEPTIL